MEYKKLKAAAEKITLSDEAKSRIAYRCQIQISNTGKESAMKTNNNKTFFRRPVIIVVALAVCLALSVTAMAASGTLKGHFSDIKNWNGAVTGTSYEQASEEIGVSVTVKGESLAVQASFADPRMFPYRESEKLGIAEYSIVDENGKAVKEGAAESADVADGKATVTIPLDDIESGSYKLIVTAFVSEKKADQPLNIYGSWECEFNK